MDGRKPCEKLRRTVVCSDYHKGGMKMIDMEKLQHSIMLEWAEMLIVEENREWKDIALFFFRHVGGESAFMSNTTSKHFNGISTVDSLFWKDVLITWLDFSNKSNCATREASILYLNDPLHNNNNIKFKGKVVYLPTSLSKGVVTVGNMMTGNRLLTIIEFQNKYGLFPRNVLDYNVIFL